MKVIKFEVVEERNIGTEDAPEIIRELVPYEMGYTEQNYETACAKAYNGEYTIEDDGQPEPEPEPTQLDRVEAQATYTAMMTDTLLEV